MEDDVVVLQVVLQVNHSSHSDRKPIVSESPLFIL